MTPLQNQSDSQTAGVNVNDIFFVLFRHKKKILLCTLAGMAAAAGVFFLRIPVYRSEAKLLVRYVVDRSAVDSIDNTTGSVRAMNDPVIDSEVEILTSGDLPVQVAEAIGAQRLLAGVKNAGVKAAARSIQEGLVVTARKGSNVITISYANRDPELAKAVLQELVNRYFTKHLEIHRSIGAFDFVTQQADAVRSRLNQTDEELKRLKGKAGIISLVESTTSFNGALAKTQSELREADVARLEQEARVKQIEKMLGNAKSEEKPVEGEEAAKQAGTADTQRYQSLVMRLGQLRQAGLDLSSKFTSDSPLVKQNQVQVDDLDAKRAALEQKFPGLAAKAQAVAGGGSQNHSMDLPSEIANLAAMTARIEGLKAQLKDLQERATLLSETAPQIAQLERQKEVEEVNYKYLQNSLEKARTDEALDPSKIPNISMIQAPSPAGLDLGKLNKVLGMLAGGGFALGIGLALLSEFVFDRTIKRPGDIESRLRIPVLLSVPYSSNKGRKRTRRANQGESTELALKTNGSLQVAAWEPTHFIRPFAEAVRDRLGLYFELTGVTHKPKLVAVTGFSDGAGSSTIAAGLAASLSETDTGKVLLVDMNLDPAEFHAFFDGKPANSLETALESATGLTPSADNLYLAAAGTKNSGPLKLGLKKFHDMMPQFKASDFDYIIFDMPPLSPTSPTLSIARFMDKVLVVIEAGKSDPVTIRRDYDALISSGADVSAVFNKERTYSPKWITG